MLFNIFVVFFIIIFSSSVFATSSFMMACPDKIQGEIKKIELDDHVSKVPFVNVTLDGSEGIESFKVAKYAQNSFEVGEKIEVSLNQGMVCSITRL